MPLLFNDRAIKLPDDSPSAVEVLGAVTEGILRRQLLVDLDSPARQIAGPQVPVFVSSAAGENLGLDALNDSTLLNAKVVAGKVQVQLRGVPDG